MATSHEVRRLLRVYAERAGRVTWDPDAPGNQMILREREGVMAALLARHGFLPLAPHRILEVGCNTGYTLASLLALGARPERLCGVDLLPDRLIAARRRHPGIRWRQGNAEQLDFPDGSFDLVLLFTVLSSILDDGMAARVAGEVVRVLRPGGAVLWYDVRYRNPWNPDVRPVPRAALRRLFPGLGRDLRTVTLLPPLARRLGRPTGALYRLLAAVPLLRSHYLGVLVKPPAPPASHSSRVIA
jgi:SAM-dependent methyltransferase